MSHRFLLLLTLAALLAGCGTGQTATPTQLATEAPTAMPADTPQPTAAPSTPEATLAPTAAAGELRVMTHDSFNVSKEVIAEFEQKEGVKVTVLPSGDAGAALNKAILSKDAPLADVFYGVDN